MIVYEAHDNVRPFMFAGALLIILLAAASTRSSGMPRPSAMAERFIPCLPRSTGLRPSQSPGWTNDLGPQGLVCPALPGAGGDGVNRLPTSAPEGREGLCWPILEPEAPPPEAPYVLFTVGVGSLIRDPWPAC